MNKYTATWGFGRFCWLSQSEVWYNNSKIVQKLAPFCIPWHVVLSFLPEVLLKRKKLTSNNNWHSLQFSELYLSHKKSENIYPASSWFLLRQTMEKLPWATVCFSIEHAQVRHTRHDASDAILICQLIFRWKCLTVRKNANFSQKRWQTNDSNQSFLVLSCAGLLSSLNTIWV